MLGSRRPGRTAAMCHEPRTASAVSAFNALSHGSCLPLSHSQSTSHRGSLGPGLTNMSSHPGLHQASSAVQLMGNVPPPCAPCLGRCFPWAGQHHSPCIIPEWPRALWRLVENTVCSPQDKRGTLFSSLKSAFPSSGYS